MNSMPFPPQAAPSYDPPPPPPPQQSQQQSSIMQPQQPQQPPLQQQPSLQQYPPQPQQIPQPRLSDITTSNNRHPQQQQQQQPRQAVTGTNSYPYSNTPSNTNTPSTTPSITVTNNTNHNSHTAHPARPTLSRPPYIDSNTNIIYDTDQPEYEGFLTKQSMWLKVRTFDRSVIRDPFVQLLSRKTRKTAGKGSVFFFFPSSIFLE